MVQLITQKFSMREGVKSMPVYLKSGLFFSSRAPGDATLDVCNSKGMGFLLLHCLTEHQ